MVRSPKADMNNIMEQTLASEQKQMPDGAHKNFQTALTLAMTALRRQDLDKAFSKAQKAFRIAQKNQWPDMQVTALMVYGNAVLGKQKYEQVRSSALQAQRIVKDLSLIHI